MQIDGTFFINQDAILSILSIYKIQFPILQIAMSNIDEIIDLTLELFVTLIEMLELSVIVKGRAIMQDLIASGFHFQEIQDIPVEEVVNAN